MENDNKNTTNNLDKKYILAVQVDGIFINYVRIPKKVIAKQKVEILPRLQEIKKLKKELTKVNSKINKKDDFDLELDMAKFDIEESIKYLDASSDLAVIKILRNNQYIFNDRQEEDTFSRKKRSFGELCEKMLLKVG